MLMTMANHYDIGDSIRLRATFTVNGVVQDPSTVTAKYRKPSGLVTTITGTTRQSTGIYFYDLLNVQESGQWWYRIQGEGTLIEAAEDEFIVDYSVIEGI